MPPVGTRPRDAKRSGEGSSTDRARVAASMSALVTPGAGQFYNGDRMKGALFLGVEILCLGAFLYLAIPYLLRLSLGMLGIDGAPLPPLLRPAVGRIGLLKYLAPLYVINRILSAWDAHRAALRRR